MFEHDRKIICHDVGASSSRTHSNGVTSEPLLGVGLAIILFDPRDLETSGPLGSPSPWHESLWATNIAGDGSVANG